MIRTKIRIAAITLAVIMASCPVCSYASEYGEMEIVTDQEEQIPVAGTNVTEGQPEEDKDSSSIEPGDISAPEDTDSTGTTGTEKSNSATGTSETGDKDAGEESSTDEEEESSTPETPLPNTENTEDTEENGDNSLEDNTKNIGNGNTPILRSTLRNASLRSTSAGDSYYDAREYGLVTPVKSQRYGDCYIYAMTALAEISMLKNMPDTYTASTLDLSEREILQELFTSTADPLGLLGTDTAVGTEYSGYDNAPLIYEFATNSCPTANDNDEPFYDTVATLKEGYHVKASSLTRSELKTLIKKYGGAAIGMPATTKNDCVYFYYTPTSSAEVYSRNKAHAIAVVGWNDNINADMFTNEYNETPSIDGGWLCKNSAGTSFGDNGYFWLSYDDAYFSTNDSICFLSMEEPDEWNVYQYDGGTSLNGTSAYNAANIFTAKANPSGTETLSRVGASLDSGSYIVNIYKYTDSSKAPWAQSELLGSTTLTVPSKMDGYATAYLEDPIRLSYGDKFAICVKRTDGSVFGIGADYSDEHNVTTVNAGESILQAKNSSAPFEDAKTSPFVGPQGANLRIKGFTICNNDGDNTIRYINRVSVDGTYTYTGTEIKPTITIYDTDDNPIPARNCKITYRNNVDAGNATIVVTAKNSNVAGRATTTFRINPKSITGATVTTSGSSPVFTGSAISPDAVVKLDGVTLSEGTDFTASYTNNTNAGSSATITATGKGNYTGSASGTFTIVPAPAGNTSIEYPSSVECTGSQIKPVVKISYNGIYLESPRDYDVTYGSNTSPGLGTFTVSYTGNFTGSATKTFTISQRDGRKCTVSYNMFNTYTGGTIKPEVEVRYGGALLTNGPDYTVGYTDNVSITDNASIVITFQGIYSGSIEKHFSIIPIDASLLTFGDILGYTDKKYDGNAKTPFIPEVSYGYTLTRNSDYTVGYENNVNAGTGYIVYAFKGNYSGTKKIPFDIEPVPFSELTIGNIGTQEYTGSAIEPDVSITWNGESLTRGVDYSIAYTDNVNGGTATATITGEGNFSGSATRNFSIHQETPAPPQDPNSGSNGNGNENRNPSSNSSGDSGNSSQTTEDPTIKKMTASGGGYKAEVTMKKEVAFSNDKKQIASNLGVNVVTTKADGTSSSIRVASVKANKPKNGSVKVTIKLKGSSKEEKKAVKQMNKSLKNISVPVIKTDLSTATSVSVTLNNKKTKVRKVTVSGANLKKSDYSASIGSDKVTITGRGNYTGTYTKNI